ncbi:MAG: VWA domain-containing protein, partial [Methylococcales bacterium]|nr:VWA domain-containing protein [Methylococcales bacterium]
MQAIAKMINQQGQSVPLTGTQIHIEQQDLVTEIEAKQYWFNAEDTNIEAVYTFSIPLDACLLNFTVKLGDKILQGQIKAKQTAEAEYEDAITDGNTAILLQQVEPGMFTVNIGNLMAKETCEVSYRYTAVQQWDKQSLRLFIPSVIAPRYGQSPLEPQQQPVSSLTHEQKFSVQMRVSGDLKAALIESPSHNISLEKQQDHTLVKLIDAAMDRDFIVNFKIDKTTPINLVWDTDQTEFCSLLSYSPPEDATTTRNNRTIIFMIDCSGSMVGDSISQAKKALQQALRELNPNDRFNILKFGNDSILMHKEPAIANQTSIQNATQWANTIDADMGGTEIFTALEIALKQGPKSDLFLVTDGEVWGDESTVDITQKASKQHSRIFTVGVGNAVSENFVRTLATDTGGSAKLVSPNESMAEHVHRHFQRIFASQIQSMTVKWPFNASNETIPETAFSGDTCIISAQMTKQPSGSVEIQTHFSSGHIQV